MKKCNYCQEIKELDLFPKKGAKCKKCTSEYYKEYREKNKELISLSAKEHYQKNKESIIAKVKEYSINNNDKIKEYRLEYNKNNPNSDYHREYREKNKELISLKKKEYYQNNKEMVKQKVREYSNENREYVNQLKRDNREKNREEANKKWCEYVKNRKETDPLYKLTCSIRSLISQSFKSQYTTKAKRTIEILGCTFEVFKEHIESQFTNEMNWDNYASYWVLDHKTPISWSESEEDVYKLNHYTNFQPLYWIDNASKGNRWSD